MPTYQGKDKRWRKGPSARHEAAIPAAALRKGFGAALRNATGVSSRGVLPDGFVIDLSQRTVTIWEVEVAHALTEAKLAKLRAIRDELGAIEWKLTVLRGCADGRFVGTDLDTGRMPVDEMRAAVAKAFGP